MGLHTATALNRWVKSAEERTLYAGRLNIGPRLILGFVFIILSMLAADAVILWQFHVVRTQAGRLNDVDQKLVAVFRVHTSVLAFHDRLDVLADAEDADRLLTEAGPLRTAVLEDIRRATSALSLPPFDPRRDPSILPTLHAIQSALPSQIEAVTTLATSRDWRAVHLRLENQVRPLESLTSELVEKVDHEVGEEQVQTVLNIKRVQRLVFLIVPLTAVFTLLIAATLGVAVTRSITQPLARLVEGSEALARREFQHQVSVSGNDELAHLGRVFNDTASRLRVLYATLQSSEDRLRLVINTIPAHAWSARPDGSVDFINRRFLEFTGRSTEDMLGWGWGSVVHPDDLTRYVEVWRAAVAMGEPMESETRVRREDGNYRWLLIRNVPLHDELGNIVNWYGTAIDIEERHRAEDALRRSETYLSEAQRLSHTGSFGWCVSTGEINWSEETFRIFQYERSTKPTIELILQRVHPEDASSFKETVARASQDGKDFEHEHRLMMPDGAVKRVHVVARAEREEAGEIEFVGAVMDITDRKRAEEALRQSEAYLAEAQRLSHTGSWAWKVGAKQQFWSVETFQIYGFDPNAITPTRESFLGRVHPDDRASIELVETELYKGNDAEYNYRVILSDGSIKYITSVAHPVRNDSGQVIDFVGTVMDVTERKRAEALRDGESRILEMIARDAPQEEILEKLVRVVEAQFAGLLCSVLLLDEDGQHVRHGAAPSLPKAYAKAIDGLSIGPKAGSCGTAMYRREPVIVTDIIKDPLWEAYRSVAEPYGFRACWSTPILAHSGKPLGSFAMYYREPRSPSPAETHALEMATHLAGIAIERKLAREGRERLRQAQMELAHVNRVTTMGELTASLAHEVNQPIAAAVTSANTCVRWLAGDVPNLEKARAAAERIVKDGTRAAEIISRIRLLFQKSALQLESVDVNKVIEEMIVLLRGEATRYSISIRTELAADLPPVMGDRVQLQQVMMNLLVNGIDAMKGVEGTRELAIKSQRAEDGKLLVSVSDTGVGLPTEGDQIFNAFFTTKPHGTGMGLRICRSIVESHGGRLWAANNSLRGASFSLTLPAQLEAHK
jgi:PAS domain S-box-containing protein